MIDKRFLNLVMEEKQISRREALRRMALYTGSLLLTPSLIAFASELMAQSGVQSDPGSRNDLFFIQRVAELLRRNQSITPVAGGGFYRIYSIVHGGTGSSSQGSIHLQREEDRLRVDVIRKGTQGHDQYLHLDQRVEGELDTPSQWSYSNRLAPAEDQPPLYGVPTVGQGSFRKGKIIIQDASGRRLYSVTQPEFTLTWNLMAAVERLPACSLPRQFDSINECDSYGGAKTLSLYKTAQIEFDNQRHLLTCYVLTGTATLPRFYWLNEAQKLLFVNSGMEIYVSEPREQNV